MSQSSFQLYNYFRSSASYRVRIALHYKKIDFEYIPVHLLNQGGEQFKENYKDLNPMAQVPTLVHHFNGEVRSLAQSVAILEYLDEQIPDSTRIFPPQAYERALVRQCVEIINSQAQPFGNLSTLNYLEAKFKMDSEQKKDWVHHWLKKCFDSLEILTKKNGKDFLVGNQVSAAEFFLIPQLFTARRFQFDLSKYSRLLAIEKKCLEMDAFQKADPAKQIDFQA